jgi:DNA-binding CsgD family transcriptional regulator
MQGKPTRNDEVQPRLAMIDAIETEAREVNTIAEFKEWTRTKIRSVFPHATLGCGYGHLHAGGVALDYVLTVDYPQSYWHGIRNRAGGLDTPILRRWLATREPQLFEAERPWPDVPAAWFECFQEHGMKNTAAHAVYDTERCVGTYHSFHRIPGRLGGAHIEALKQLVPVMHEVLCRVVGLLNVENKFALRLAGLSAREKEIAKWVGLGRTNGEIAGLSGLSENTVKHHLTKIFAKLAVETRAQLIHRLAECETKAAPGFGTKIM